MQFCVGFSLTTSVMVSPYAVYYYSCNVGFDMISQHLRERDCFFLCVNGVYSSISSAITYHDTATILVEMYIGVLGDWFKAMPNRRSFRPVVCSCDLMGVDYTGATAFEVCTYQVRV